MKIYSRIAMYLIVAWVIPILIYLMYDKSLAGLLWGIIVSAAGLIIEIIFVIQNYIRDRKVKNLRK